MGSSSKSLTRQLIVSLALANAIILVLSAALYLWRGYGANEGEMIDILKNRAVETAVRGISITGQSTAIFDSETGAAKAGSDPELIAHLPRMIGHGLTDGVLSFSTNDGPHYIAVATVMRDGRESTGAVLHRGPLSEGVWDWLGHEIRSDVMPIFAPLFVITLAVSAWTVRRALAPVVALSRQARQVGPENLGMRLDEIGVPNEIQPLVRAINAGFDRVEAGFASQRRFTANAAHELRTPLAVLTARMEKVADCGLRERLGQDAARMAKVVEQLLSVARLEARGIEMSGPVDLAETAEQVVADMFPLAQSSGRSIGLEALERPVLSEGNQSALYDSLRNLVENALRFTPDGGSVEVVVGPGAAIRVIDCGPGVPDAKKNAIFEPFYRGLGAQGGGAGLGLNIAREAVRLHGGELSVEQAQGGGAVFAMKFIGS